MKKLFFKKMNSRLIFLLVFMGSGLQVFSFSAASSPQSFTYQGQLTDLTGAPNLSSNVSFKIEIFDPLGACLLLEEDFAGVDLSATQGQFSFAIGTGVPGTNHPGLNFTQIFSNHPVQLRPPSANCGSGYTPAFTDIRKLRVTVNDGVTTETLPLQDLNSVPFSMNTSRFAGREIDKFVTLVTTPGAGEDSQYLRWNNGTSSYEFGVPGGGGSVTSVNLGAPGEFTVSGGPVTTSGTLNLAWTSQAINTVFAPPAGTAGIPSFRLLAQTDIPNLDWSKIQSTPTTLAGYGITDGQTTSLPSGRIFVGDGGNNAVGVNLTGDATLSLAGVLTLGASGVTAATYPKVTVNAKGLVTAGAALAEADIPTLATAGKVSGTAINAGTIGGTTALNITGAISTTSMITGTGGASFNSVGTTTLGVQQAQYNDDDDSNHIKLEAPSTVSTNFTLTLPSDSGTSGQVLSTDGSGVLSWVTNGSGGITSLNGLTGGAQTFTAGTAGADFNVSSSGAIHTFNFPSASGSARGLLTSGDWTQFNGKLGTNLSSSQVWIGNGSNVATPVSLSGDATITNTGAVTVEGIRGNSIDATAPADGSFLIFTSGGSQYFSRTLSGDATLSNTGALNLNTSGVTAGTYPKVTVDTKGRVTAGATLVAGDLPAEAAVDGGNTLGADLDLGTDDAFPLNFQTNGASRMTISSLGVVGIGTLTPVSSAILELSSTTKAFLPPRMTTVQRDAISPQVGGMVIYNTAMNGLEVHNGTTWAPVSPPELVQQITEQVLGGGVSTFDFANGAQVVVPSPGSSVLTITGSMQPGRNYTVIVADTVSRTYTFSGCPTSKFSPANGGTTAATQTIYRIYYSSVSGGTCYIKWSSGYG